jgi:hypothetical protein
MQAQEASEALQLIERLQRRTRASLRVVWFPLVVFGSLFLASAPLAWLGSGPAVGVYWALAGTAGGVTVGRYYQRRERELGLEGPWFPYLITGLGIMVGCFAVVALGKALDSEMTVAVGPCLIVSAGYLVFAVLDRSATLGGVAAGLGAVSLALAASGWEPREVGAMLAVIYGGAFVATGLACRWRERELI